MVPRIFLKKLFRSWFGFKTIRRILIANSNRRRILQELKKPLRQTEINSGEVYLKTRKELVALLGAPALLLDDEVGAIQRYAARIGDTMVEIGVAFGGSSLLFLLAKQPRAQLYSIDPFIQDSMGGFQASENECRRKVVRALSDINLRDRADEWTLVPDYSYKYVKHFKKPIDLFFVDGDHQYEAVRRDFQDWFPLVRSGGYILFHDSCRIPGTPEGIYNKGWPGPSRLVSEILTREDIELLERVESLSILRKKI